VGSKARGTNSVANAGTAETVAVNVLNKTSQ